MIYKAHIALHFKCTLSSDIIQWQKRYCKRTFSELGKGVRATEGQEIFSQLEEHTRLETFLGVNFASHRKALSYCFGGKIDISPSIEIPEEVMSPSHDFQWNTDRTSLAYLGNTCFNQFTLEEKGPLGRGLCIGLLKMPRFLDLVDISLDLVCIAYVLRGKRKMIIDGDEIILDDGNAVIFTPNTNYSSIFIDENDITVHVFVPKKTFLKCCHKVLSVCVGEEISFFRDSFFLELPANYLVVRSAPDKRLLSFVTDMLREQELQRPFSEVIILNSIELFLCHLMSDYGSGLVIGREMMEIDRTVSLIVKHMRSNYADLSLDTLARRFSLSSSYITRLLKEKTGKSYIQLLTEIKLDIAKELLSVGSLSIEDISAIAGYNCTRQFRRVFNETFGIGPKEFMRSRR